MHSITFQVTSIKSVRTQSLEFRDDIEIQPNCCSTEAQEKRFSCGDTCLSSWQTATTGQFKNEKCFKTGVKGASWVCVALWTLKELQPCALLL